MNLKIILKKKVSKSYKNNWEPKALPTEKRYVGWNLFFVIMFFDPHSNPIANIWGRFCWFAFYYAIRQSDRLKIDSILRQSYLNLYFHTFETIDNINCWESSLN